MWEIYSKHETHTQTLTFKCDLDLKLKWLTYAHILNELNTECKFNEHPLKNVGTMSVQETHSYLQM